MQLLIVRDVRRGSAVEQCNTFHMERGGWVRVHVPVKGASEHTPQGLGGGEGPVKAERMG